jgi:hypothetical protein
MSCATVRVHYLLRDRDVRGDCRLLLLRVGDREPVLDISGDRLHMCVLYATNRY